MTASITIGAAATITVSLRSHGAPVAIPETASVSARFYTPDGVVAISPSVVSSKDNPLGDWPAGVPAFTFSASDTEGLMEPNSLLLVTLVHAGVTSEWRVMFSVTDPSQPGSALFPNRAAAIAKMRCDRLMLAAKSILPDIQLSDSYLWDKLLAAEAHARHVLRVPLAPTRFFPLDPTPEQLAAIGDMPWDLDPPYDWLPDTFMGDKWGYMLLRNRPIIDIHDFRVTYPSTQNTVLDVPMDWLRLDKKYGHLNLVPTSPLAIQTVGAVLIPMLSGGRRLPFAVHIEYTAGLQDVRRNYPDLLDVVFKLATIGVLEDSYLPQSGSISADGLSQSTSIDTDKYHEAVERILYGPDGGNGGLVAKINGIRMMVV